MVLHLWAKYINSPETALFVKSKTVYQSPEWRRQDTTVIVEGYFDVMAVHAIANAVAPLGTAMTADQLQHVWKRCPCPVVCFDGDSAGQKAQFKLAVLALSLLRPGYSLSFVILPSGEDPCAVMMVKGAAVMKELIHHAMSLSDYVWSCLFKGRMTPDTACVGCSAMEYDGSNHSGPHGAPFLQTVLVSKRQTGQRQRGFVRARPPAGGQDFVDLFRMFPRIKGKIESSHKKCYTSKWLFMEKRLCFYYAQRS